jgi:hypothetical protein
MPIHHEVPEEIISHLDFHTFRVVGRLKPGVTAAEAIANLSTISLQLHNSQLDNPFIAAAANSRSLIEHMVGDVERPLYVMLAATACQLLIACLNVANLLVARAAVRRKELAIRAALGGGRIRLLRGHLMESFLLETVGGGVGLLLAYAAIQLARTYPRQYGSRRVYPHCWRSCGFHGERGCSMRILLRNDFSAQYRQQTSAQPTA